MRPSVCASASSERRRRKYANTPSAMNARSCCPIALCRRKNRAAANRPDARACGSRRLPLASPAIWFARGLIEYLSRFGARCIRLGRPCGAWRSTFRASRAAVIAGRKRFVDANRIERGLERGPEDAAVVGLHAHLHRDVAQRWREPHGGVRVAILALAAPALRDDLALRPRDRFLRPRA